jgi:hypothetical protein
MTIEEFIAGAKADLGDFVRESGVILYSSPKTLKVGNVYLLGINPGADPDGLDDPDIETHLDKLASSDTNRYIDGEWDRGRIGTDPFQLRVVWLLRSLGLDPRDVCSSNLIFRRSDGQGTSGYPETAYRCWPVHQRILSIVQPKMIICLGNLPFDYVTSRGSSESPQAEEFPSGHGSWQCRSARVHLESRSIDIVRLPHLRRYRVIGKQPVVDWMRKKLLFPPPLDTHQIHAIQHSSSILSPAQTSSPVSSPTVPGNADHRYQAPWNGIDGYIVLTGEPFSARGARGRAWDTLRSRNWIAVRDWIPIAKRAGNTGCGRGDLEILCNDRRATVIVDSMGKQMYPATTAPRKWERPARSRS